MSVTSIIVFVVAMAFVVSVAIVMFPTNGRYGPKGLDCDIPLPRPAEPPPKKVFPLHEQGSLTPKQMTGFWMWDGRECVFAEPFPPMRRSYGPGGWTMAYAPKVEDVDDNHDADIDETVRAILDELGDKAVVSLSLRDEQPTVTALRDRTCNHWGKTESSADTFAQAAKNVLKEVTDDPLIP